MTEAQPTSHHARLPTPHNPENRPRGWRKARATYRREIRESEQDAKDELGV